MDNLEAIYKMLKIIEQLSMETSLCHVITLPRK